jgi:hypothetical protein
MLGRSALLSVAFWIAFVGVLRIAVVPPESCGDANRDAITDAAVAAEGWLQRNQGSDGRYVYIYDRDSDTISSDYNEVRHAGVTMALYQAAGRFQDAEALDAADAGLAWMSENLIRQDGWAALAPGGGRAKLGASALMLVALAERRLATVDPQHDDLMRELGRFIVTLQRGDDGFYVAWLTAERSPQLEGTSRFFPGEAFWALALLHEAFPGEGWDRPARLAADFLTTRRDEVEDVSFPPLADQWTAYGLAEMVEWGLHDHHIDYARRLAGRFGFLIRVEAQRQGGPLGTLVRRWEIRAAAAGTWVEGMAALWRLASVDERLADLRPKIEERLICAGGILAEQQVSGEDADTYAQPDLVEGAWFVGGETRMDDQQHAFSGLLYTVDALDDRLHREPDAPMTNVASP